MKRKIANFCALSTMFFLAFSMGTVVGQSNQPALSPTTPDLPVYELRKGSVNNLVQVLFVDWRENWSFTDSPATIDRRDGRSTATQMWDALRAKPVLPEPYKEDWESQSPTYEWTFSGGGLGLEATLEEEGGGYSERVLIVTIKDRWTQAW